ncbi:MAG: OmpA family protein [Gallionella sp.]|nr:OmpA family protein [Gallionella sp.]
MKASKIFFGLLAMAILPPVGIASADEITREGYLTDSRGNVIRNSYDNCWRNGSWTPAMAIPECDPDLAKKDSSTDKNPTNADATAVPPVAPPETKEDSASPATPDTSPAAPIALRVETLFDCDKAILSADSKKILDDEVVSKMMQYPQINVLQLTAYADRIGSADYNLGLSLRRANTVKAYLVSRGIEEKRLEASARGEAEQVISCSEIKGKESCANQKLAQCLQPNRRVIIKFEAQM